VKSNYLAPFVEGVTELVSTMFQSPCHVAIPDCDATADVSGVIDLVGETHGRFALSFPRGTATRMVAQLLSLDETEVDDGILGDGVGELANIVAGVAKSRLASASSHFAISLPSIVLSESHRLPQFDVTGVLHRIVTTDLGEFSLRIWFPT
jgi:chemotaxis protein CheX